MKKKNLIIKLALFVLLLSLSFMLVACGETESKDKGSTTTPTIDYTKDLLIENSDFVVADSSASYPRTAGKWTGAVFSSNLPSGVTAGIIDVSDDKYAANKSTWDNLSNPGKADGSSDNRMLMIYMPKKANSTDTKHGNTAYGYTSNSFTIQKNAYYKFTVSVKTVNLDGGTDKGARVYLSSSAFAEFSSIDTNGEWTTYTAYIQGSQWQDSTLTVNLSLGYYSSSITANQLTTGYAFFDNVKLEKMTEKDGKSAAAQYAEAGVNEYTQKITYHVPNGDFDYGTLASGSSSALPSLWSSVTGGSNTSFSAPTTYRYNGIVDTEPNNFKELQSKLGTSRYIYKKYLTITKAAYDALSDADKANYALVAGTEVYRNKEDSDNVEAVNYYSLVTNPGTVNGLSPKVYMLSNTYMTAQGIKSSSPIVVEKGGYTKVSVSVYTQHIFGAGVSIRLTGNGDDFAFQNISKPTTALETIGGKEIDVYQVTNSKTNSTIFYNSNGEVVPESYYMDRAGSTGGWVTYSFYVKGNAYMDTSFNVELWLGTGDTSENTEKTISSFSSSGYSSKTDFKTYTANGTFAKGWAFFDGVSVSKISETEYNAISGTAMEYSSSKADRIVDGTNKDAKIDLSIANGLTANANFENAVKSDANKNFDAKTLGTPVDWKANVTDGKVDGVFLSSDTVAGTIDVNSFDFASLNLKNPKLPYDFGSSKVYMVYSNSNIKYTLQSSTFTLTQNNCYRITVWLKTDNASSGIRVSLIDADTKETLKSSSVINSKNVDNDYNNGWIDYSFNIRGYSNKNLNATLLLEYGYGTRWNASTLNKGAGYFANVSVVNIPLSTYTTLSSNTSYSTSQSYETTETSKTIANGSFGLYDLSKTEGIEGGKLSGDVGYVKNWTKSDNKIDAIKSGVIGFNTTDGLKYTVESGSQIANLQTKYPLLNTLGTASSSIYDSWEAPNGGPNALLIANTDAANKHAVGYQSSSISLSANSYYKISVWAYADAGVKYSVYLDSENTVTNFFDEAPAISKTTTVAGWTEYVFYIQVGLNSASLNLNLWLGDNANIFNYSNKDDAKTNGYVVFDSAVCQSINSEEFLAATKAENSRKMSFVTDGFDAQSTNAESKSTLTSATGWTGKVGTNCVKSNTKSGIYYFSGVGGDYEISDLFGLDLKGTINLTSGTHYKNTAKATDFIPISETVGKIYSDPACTTLADNGIYYKKSDTEVITLATTTNDATKETVLAKYELNTEEREASFINYNDLKTHSGKYALAINNVENSSYYYTSSSYSLAKESIYKISVWVKTNKLEEGKGAFIKLASSGLDYADAKKTFSKIVANDWTEYVYYVKTADAALSGLTVSLGLGEVDDDDNPTLLAKGYALFDDFKIEKVSETEFDGIVENDNVKKFTAKDSDISIGGDKKDNSGESEYKPDLTYLWWMIPTIILAVATIIVIIVFAVRKFKQKHPKKQEVEANYETDATTTEAVERKQDLYKNRFDESNGVVEEKKVKKSKKK